MPRSLQAGPCCYAQFWPIQCLSELLQILQNPLWIFFFPVPTALCLCAACSLSSLCVSLSCSMAICAMTTSCDWQHGKFSGADSLPPGISLLFFPELTCLLTLPERKKHTNNKPTHRRDSVQQASIVYTKSVTVKGQNYKEPATHNGQ